MIQNKPSNKDWGSYCSGISAEKMWSKEEKNCHINILQIITVKIAILIFTKGRASIVVPLLISCKATLSCLLKIEGNQNKQLLIISKEIWQYLLANRIMITVEYLPTKMNVRGDWESITVPNIPNVLLPSVLQTVTKIMRQSTIDLFASRLSHQLPHYINSCSLDDLEFWF